MVEGGDEPDVLGEQHAVAEDVTAHVADPDDREVVGLGVQAHLAEVRRTDSQAPRAVIPIALWS
jgi:hypothetical protein